MHHSPLRLRRSALFMPASNPRAIEKSRALACDIVILDLEDAVAPEQKAAAREAARAAAAAGGFGHRELWVRCNGLDTAWGHDDLSALACAGFDAILAPKVRDVSDLSRYEATIAICGARTKVWAMLESCSAVLALPEFARHGSARFGGMVLGLNDLALEMRARPGKDRSLFHPMMLQAVMAARAAGRGILDAVYNDFRDDEGLRRQCEEAAAMGFDGKSLIHPGQLAICNQAFAPSPAAIERAHAIVAAFALPENAGKGAINVGGAMVELLHRREAEALLALADEIAGREGGR